MLISSGSIAGILIRGAVRQILVVLFMVNFSPFHCSVTPFSGAKSIIIYVPGGSHYLAIFIIETVEDPGSGCVWILPKFLCILLI